MLTVQVVTVGIAVYQIQVLMFVVTQVTVANALIINIVKLENQEEYLLSHKRKIHLLNEQRRTMKFHGVLMLGD